MRLWFLILAAGIAIVAIASLRIQSNRGQVATYLTARIERGDIVQTVRATGSVRPSKMIQVGTQVTGQVPKLYVDFNDRVKQGDLVAQIDPTVYQARLAQDNANVAQSLARMDETQARLTQSEKTLARARELMGRDMLSLEELDAAVAAHDSLAAQLRALQATVDQAKALQRLSQANLDYTTIRSPVDGVVISRNVDEGQTVVASLAAQVLFVIATDLRMMQVEASVPEADIGKILTGQPVAFTVDAFANSFSGVVSQVRLAPAVVQGVVTYPVVIAVENPDDKLRPGMTANITCEVARRCDVLKVPNAALRFRPAARPSGTGAEVPPGPTVWIRKKTGSDLSPIPVVPGIGDGVFTEIAGTDGLGVGQEVILGLSTGNPLAAGTVNPFTPKLPGASHPRR